MRQRRESTERRAHGTGGGGGGQRHAMGILMSLSTVVVALNAQLLRRVDLRPRPGHA